VQVFGSKVAIFSNTAGSVDDIGHRKAIEIEKYFGISVIRHKEKKPGGVNDVLNFFKCDKEQIAVIGDRYLTDILFGNMHGMLTIHTSPLTKDGESVTVAIVCDLKQITEALNSQKQNTSKCLIICCCLF
jgi:phosphatidylglycerophosphatase GEP4